ncbi:CBS domain-containing protein [Streptomyces sp. CNQ-509]|uniref:CBS domain-containing protein n=1 Tax=Streptomyces sp. CNQ-509 TaxID=444103 RepID=UPI00062DF06E|nr:CBS domain-containing protein [Streptomyces sp. CNQ-509]AKH85778.1 CBS domain-containing protein [Streptomyces sp. CNQ-509]
MNHSPYLVSDVMTHTVVAVGPEASFKEIAEAMRKWRVSALPVLEGDGRVTGVVSEADLLPKEEYRDSALSVADRDRRPDGIVKAGAVVARDLMTTPAVSVRADATLAEAARAMARRRLKRLPVVDAEGHLTGIVSRGDLLKVFLRPDEDIAEDVQRQVLDPLFPLGGATVHARVDKGVVTLSGWFRNTSLVPLAARMARAVEGVVDVGFRLERPGGAPSGDGQQGRRGAVSPGHEGDGPGDATAPPPAEPR